MKTLKLAMIAILLATAMVNTANAADEPKVNQASAVINLTFQQAIQSAGLVAAMYNQLNGGFLGGPGIQYITLKVTYQGHVYLITGTSEEWSLFFNHKGITSKRKSGS
jgi:hypothetical protein